jgi:hypothetical protein
LKKAKPGAETSKKNEKKEQAGAIEKMERGDETRNNILKTSKACKRLLKSIAS